MWKALTLVLIYLSLGTTVYGRWDTDLKEMFTNHGAAARALQALSSRLSAYVGISMAPAWRGRLDTRYLRDYFAPAIAVNKCDEGPQQCTHNDWVYPYEKYIVDPTDPQSKTPVMMVHYPAGSWSPSSEKPGGTLFYAYPYKVDPLSTANPFSRAQATLEYEVFFPSDFQFVKGGKLPGFSGGEKNGRGCGGGADPAHCFSFRLMWRREGAGEAYLYVPEDSQSQNFCGTGGLPACGQSGPYPCTECNYKAGVSFNRGAWFWKRGAWNHVKMSMALNPAGQQTGEIEVQIDGKTVISFKEMNYRNDPAVNLEGVLVSTWYGGSDTTWGPTTDQYLLFRNFKAYRTDEPQPMGDRTSVKPITKQVVVEEYMQEP